MEITQLLQTIFEVVLIPLLAVLTGYVIKWINAKSDELIASTDDIYANKYITMLQDTIVNTVISINQTYVDALKNKNAFTIEAQKTAFTMVYNKVMETLTDEAYNYLSSIIGDLEEYITIQIEAAVRENKITINK